MSLYFYRQFFGAKITPFLKYILAEYHFWYSNARFRTVAREKRGFGAAVGLPSTPGRKLLRMQSVGFPLGGAGGARKKPNAWLFQPSA